MNDLRNSTKLKREKLLSSAQSESEICGMKKGEKTFTTTRNIKLVSPWSKWSLYDLLPLFKRTSSCRLWVWYMANRRLMAKLSTMKHHTVESFSPEQRIHQVNWSFFHLLRSTAASKSAFLVFLTILLMKNHHKARQEMCWQLQLLMKEQTAVKRNRFPRSRFPLGLFHSGSAGLRNN